MSSPFQNAMHQLDDAAKIIGDDINIDHLRQPKRILEAKIPVVMDNGTTKEFKAFRVQYNNDCGPFKGGIRFHPQVDLDEVKALSFWMTIKTSAVGLPLGGGKGGVEVDPKTLSTTELENLSRGYARAFADNLGPKIDVPAPDINTNSQIMDWIADEYGKIKGGYQPAVITGKSLAKGGSLGRGTATADGGYYILEELMKERGLDPINLTVVVQGFGNAGGNMVKLLDDGGYKVIGVSDSKAGIIDPTGNGFDYNVLKSIKETQGTFKTYSNETTKAYPIDHQILEPDKILEVECDILVVAALENVITKDNAKDIKAKIIVELANGPTTPEADQILKDQGITVIPDVLANAGGVTVSYFEWQQNMANEQWTEEEVKEKLKLIMIEAYQNIKQTAEKHKISLRTATFVAALKRECLTTRN